VNSHWLRNSHRFATFALWSNSSSSTHLIWVLCSMHFIKPIKMNISSQLFTLANTCCHQKRSFSSCWIVYFCFPWFSPFQPDGAAVDWEHKCATWWKFNNWWISLTFLRKWEAIYRKIHNCKVFINKVFMTPNLSYLFSSLFGKPPWKSCVQLGGGDLFWCKANMLGGPMWVAICKM
jgi:hypothetical protein